MVPRLGFLMAACAAALATSACGSNSTTVPNAPATWIRTDAAAYATDNDLVRIAVTNLGDVTLEGATCDGILEMWSAGAWHDGSQQPVAGHACPNPAIILGPGSTYYLDTIRLGHVDPGLYRFRLDGLSAYQGVLAADQRVTNSFRIQ